MIHQSSKKNAVEVKGFGFAYPQAKEVFSSLSFQVEEGSFLLLVGETGSGKTTLLRSMKPELAPEGSKNGSISIFGKETTDFSPEESVCEIAYVSQNPEVQICCDTVWHELAFGLENLGVQPKIMRRRVAEVAGFFGLESLMNARTSELSGGQMQILSLASALAMQPRLLLLDEPSAQLDPLMEKNFVHALFRINRELGITIIVATHDPKAMADYATAMVEMPPLVRLTKDASTEESTDAVEQTGSTMKNQEFNQDVIRLKKLHYRYEKAHPWVFQDLDLVIKQGDIHAIVGGNGSGKTTLLRLIAGLARPQHGRVINELSTDQVFLPQDPKTLFVGDTLEEELKEWQASAGYTDECVEEFLTLFDLQQCKNQHPYDLSGGQQQKLALAKLLLTKPRLLLLDEPTKGLDDFFKSELAGMLEKAKHAGITLVLVSHDLEFVSSLADKVSLVFDREVACTETAEVFFEGNLFYRPRKETSVSRLEVIAASSAFEETQ